jgi:primosomal protein N' (replication factor Y)
MYVQVKFLNGHDKKFWYTCTDRLLLAQIVAGAVVWVPLRDRSELALVLRLTPTESAEISYALREIQGVEAMPPDIHYTSFINRLAWYYQIDPVFLMMRFKSFLQADRKKVDMSLFVSHIAQTVLLTHEQQAIVDGVTPSIVQGVYQPFVIQGVTGSGKTEVYKALAQQAIAAGKTVLFLVPEVRLAIHFELILQTQMPNVPIFGFHSGKLTSEKKVLWGRLFTKAPVVIVGVHMPILLPIANLGLIIIDEEHDMGYQEKKHPKINTKEAALMRAHMASIPVVLGSATPAVQTLYNVQTKQWKLFHLKQRFSGAFPRITSVLLTDKKKWRRSFWISQELDTAIADRLAKKEQTIIFLNRRGYSFFLQCTACSFIVRCKSCSVSLTVHEDKRLSCHYCGYQCPEPDHCLSCKAGQDKLLKKGIGTQQMVTRLQTLYPTARIARADLDTSARKKEWQETMADFSQGAIDILVGTQTITKGYHFPQVTLVGIIWADMGLHVPLFNAGECAVQQLMQVAGRAGRVCLHSDVIVQAMDNHPLLMTLDERLYDDMVRQELERRQELGYPPYKRLAEIDFRSTYEDAVIRDSNACADHIADYCRRKGYVITVLGPTLPPVHKVSNIYMRKIYLKGEHIHELIDAYRSIEKTTLVSALYFTPHPQR